MRRAHALIIDDDPVNNKVLANLLEMHEVSSTLVEATGNFPDVLVDLPDCDLVFLDLEMPGLDGYEVFDLLASDTRFAAVPVIVCSVHTNEMANTRHVGLDGFIAKPLDSRRFPDQLNRILRGEAVWDAR
ncbi:MAG: response regulator [Chloroflexi bacterium]|nr:response regulator [Chloroflexota bacterium]